MEDLNSNQLSANEPEYPDIFANNWSPKQLIDFRHKSITEAAKHGHIVNEFTCDNCTFKFQCEFVYDIYNTDGDCLASK